MLIESDRSDGGTTISVWRDGAIQTVEGINATNTVTTFECDQLAGFSVSPTNESVTIVHLLDISGLRKPRSFEIAGVVLASTCANDRLLAAKRIWDGKPGLELVAIDLESGDVSIIQPRTDAEELGANASGDVIFTPRDWATLLVLRAGSKEPTEIAPPPESGHDFLQFDFSADGRSIYALTRKGLDEGTRTIWRLDVAEGRWTKLVAETSAWWFAVNAKEDTIAYGVGPTLISWGKLATGSSNRIRFLSIEPPTAKR